MENVNETKDTILNPDKENGGKNGAGTVDTTGVSGSDEVDDVDEEEDDEPQELTKEELAKLFEKERRKAVRDYKKSRHSGKQQKEHKDDSDDEKSEKLAEREKRAMARELNGVIKSNAADRCLSAKGAKAALKLADFSECYDEDGELDEEAVNDILDDFAEEYPEFITTTDEDAEKQPRFAATTSKVSTGKKSTDEAYLNNKYGKNPFFKK